MLAYPLGYMAVGDFASRAYEIPLLQNLHMRQYHSVSFGFTRLW